MVDTKISLEPIYNESENESNINVKIKQERELIIENDSEWLPIKLEDEHNEYYQEFVEDYENVAVRNKAFELFTIEYIEENNDDDEEDDNEYYSDSEDGGTDEAEVDSNEDVYKEYANNYQEDFEKQEDVFDGNESSESNVICKYTLNKWLLNNYVNRECPACKKQLSYYNEYRRHIESTHQDNIKQAESNYNLSGQCGVCKKCNKELVTSLARYLHAVRHTKEAESVDVNICKLCNHRSARVLFIQKHIVKEHPETVDKFKKAFVEKTPFKCPICRYTYNKYNQLWYHFMDKHPQEYKAKFYYNCHLCFQDPFCDEKQYLQHLIEKHELNSWKVLNYRELSEDKGYFACTKCHRIFIKNDIRTFLKHYLRHENNSHWTCKFCCKHIMYKKFSNSHMCTKMLKYYSQCHEDAQDDKAQHQENSNSRIKIENIQEFEEYIAHVCPFCKIEFTNLIKWQQHLRNDHEIDTLKGLQMKVIPSDNSRLCCVICHTVVANSPVQLHAHRFQHLPYMPYKCQHCSLTLSTFKMAVNHVLKQCNDADDRYYISNLLLQKKFEPSFRVRSKIEIRCVFCNYKKFNNVKAVWKHYEDEHNNFKEFFSKSPHDNSMSCIVCNKQYVQYDKNVCLEHMQHHFHEKTFKCPLCELSYVRFKSCLHHLCSNHYAKTVSHQKSKEKIKIPGTSYFLNKEDNLTQNCVTAQLAKPSIYSHTLNEFAEFISFACPECNEGMTTQEDWACHITTQHNFFDDANLSFKDVDGSLKCPTCKLNMASSLTHRQKHRLTHMPYRSFMCNLCYARFTSLGILYGHFRRRHFAQGTFKCPICPKILPTSHQRSDHLKKTHPRNEWPIRMCLICYKVMSSKSALNTHMATHDADRLRYTCLVCGSKLIELRDFKLHMARHESRAEINEQEKATDDDIILQSGFEERQASDTVDKIGIKDLDQNEVALKSKNENLNKRKSLTNSSPKRKKKTNTK